MFKGASSADKAVGVQMNCGFCSEWRVRKRGESARMHPNERTQKLISGDLARPDSQSCRGWGVQRGLSTSAMHCIGCADCGASQRDETSDGDPVRSPRRCLQPLQPALEQRPSSDPASSQCILLGATTQWRSQRGCPYTPKNSSWGVRHPRKS